MDKGIFCTIRNAKINKDIVNKIYKEMKAIVEDDYVFTKLSVSRLDAIKYFKKLNQLDKVNVLKYISNTYVNLYRLDEYYDYFFSEMPYSTSLLDEFALTYIKENGFVLSYPTVHNPKVTEDYEHEKKIFDSFLNYTKLGKTIDFAKYDVNAKDINSFGFSTIDEGTNWATKLATEVQRYYGDSEEETIAAAQKMFGETISTNDLSQYYIVAEPTAFIYSKVGKFYTYATGYEYMVVLDDIDVYTGSYAWNLWESQGRVTFLGYMFNGMYMEYWLYNNY
jgi:hypothetical protein